MRSKLKHRKLTPKNTSPHGFSIETLSVFGNRWGQRAESAHGGSQGGGAEPQPQLSVGVGGHQGLLCSSRRTRRWKAEHSRDPPMRYGVSHGQRAQGGRSSCGTRGRQAHTADATTTASPCTHGTGTSERSPVTAFRVPGSKQWQGPSSADVREPTICKELAVRRGQSGDNAQSVQAHPFLGVTLKQESQVLCFSLFFLAF